MPGWVRFSNVTTVLPAGFNVGESGTLSNIRYRLVNNNSANSVAAPGTILTPVGGGGATPYSMTVTTVSAAFNNLGACVVVHTTVPTGAYFLGRSGRTNTRCYRR